MALDFTNSKNAKKAVHMQQKMLTEGNAPISKLLPLESIIENEDNELIYDMDKLDELIENIDEDGFTDPIGVYDLKNGKYEIFSGHKSYRAMKQKNEKTIPCVIFPMPKDSVERARRLIKSNSLNRDYSPLTKAKELKYYYDNVTVPENKPGKKRTQLAKDFGMSEGQVAKLLSLLQLIPELQTLADNEELAFSAFSPAAQLSEKQQKDLFDVVMDSKNEDGTFSMTRSEITKYIKKLQGVEVEENIEKENIISTPVMNPPETAGEEKINEKADNMPVEESSSNHVDSTPSPVTSEYLPEEKRGDITNHCKGTPVMNMSEEKIVTPTAKMDIDFVLKTELDNMKQINIQNMRIFNENNVRKYIKDLKDILAEIENSL